MGRVAGAVAASRAPRLRGRVLHYALLSAGLGDTCRTHHLVSGFETGYEQAHSPPGYRAHPRTTPCSDGRVDCGNRCVARPGHRYPTSAAEGAMMCWQSSCAGSTLHCSPPSSPSRRVRRGYAVEAEADLVGGSKEWGTRESAARRAPSRPRSPAPDSRLSPFGNYVRGRMRSPPAASQRLTLIPRTSAMSPYGMASPKHTCLDIIYIIRGHLQRLHSLIPSYRRAIEMPKSVEDGQSADI